MLNTTVFFCNYHFFLCCFFPLLIEVVGHVFDNRVTSENIVSQLFGFILPSIMSFLFKEHLRWMPSQGRQPLSVSCLSWPPWSWIDWAQSLCLSQDATLDVEESRLKVYKGASWCPVGICSRQIRGVWALVAFLECQISGLSTYGFSHRNESLDETSSKSDLLLALP